MTNKANLLVNTGVGASQVVSLNTSEPIYIVMRPGAKYVLKNKSDNYGPEGVALQKSGNDLNVIFNDEKQPSIIVKDYYTLGEDVPIMGMADDGQLYTYVVSDGSSVENYQINDGATVPVSMGGVPQGSGEFLFPELSVADSYDLPELWPWYAAGAAIAVGGIGYAIYDNNKSDGKKSSSSNVAIPEKAVIKAVTDDVGLVTGTLSAGQVTDDSKPTITGTGEASATVTIYNGTTSLGTTKVAADGTWSFTPTTALTDATYKITAVQSNSAGSSAASAEFTFVVDTTVPDKPVLSGIIDDVGTITGTISNGGTTDDTRPEFQGTGTAGNTVIIYIDDKEQGKVIIGTDGKWTYTLTADLKDGKYQFTAKERDPAGNTSDLSATFDFTVDTVAPSQPTGFTIVDNVGSVTGALKSGDVTNDNKPVFSGTGEVGNTITIKNGTVVLGKVTVDKDGNWSFTPTDPLTQSSHSITITETDKGGNTSKASAAIEFVVDTSVPNSTGVASLTDDVGTKTGSIASGGVTDDSTPLLSGKGEVGNTVVLKNGDAELGKVTVDKDGNWSFTPTTALADGTYKITTIETDRAGNSSLVSSVFEFTVDTKAPVNSGVFSMSDFSSGTATAIPNNGSTTDTRPEISGKGEPGNEISIMNGTAEVGNAIVDATGNWTFVPKTPLATGVYNLTVVETDKAGNTGTASTVFTFTVKTALQTSASLSDDIDPTDGHIISPSVKSLVTDSGDLVLKSADDGDNALTKTAFKIALADILHVGETEILLNNSHSIKAAVDSSVSQAVPEASQATLVDSSAVAAYQSHAVVSSSADLLVEERVHTDMM